MTASEVVSGWPDKATVELVTTAISQTRGVLDIDTDDIPDNQWRTLARAALSVLPDPTADTVLLDQVREVWASDGWVIATALYEWAKDQEVDADDRQGDEADELFRQASVARSFAALLAGGGE
jgi:hypothetical protein